MKQFINCLLFTFALCISTKAQNSNNTANIMALKKAARVFMDTAYLHIDMTYKYSSENSPEKYLDTLSGSLKTWQNKFRYNMDNTEAICDKNNLVVVYKEDRILYLSTPEKGNMATQQFALLDSLFAGAYPFESFVTEDQQALRYTIHFSQPTVYKQMEFWVNKKGEISRTRQVLAAELFSGQVKDGGLALGDWMVVDVNYTKYTYNDFNREDFNTTKIVRKEKNQWLPLAPYEAYSVFKAKPNL